eukprot:TRINITY_DN94_c0_g1_i2.p1 TRINITY_DN94_c0_g1~~TRINITY_DN94_c0_g1_i2.p1  ORF type:complete len:508 (-),score=165.61 TRINITY_DN94_c0_g1_i2:134-1606(-)
MAEQTSHIPQAQDPLKDQFGALPLIKSTSKTGRVWGKVKDLGPAAAGQEVWVRVRIHQSRGKGKICFLLLRQQSFTIQAVLSVTDTISPEFLKFAHSLNNESIVDVLGEVKTVTNKIESATQKDVELHVKKLFLVSQSEARPPLLVEDAARPAHVAAQQGLVEPDQSTRLDHRVIDLRTPANQAIFRVQSAVGNLFRKFLLSKNFMEIHTPKLIPVASEGGSNVFEVRYFEGKAYLAQSPQLYKQMAVNADFPRVFEIGPVFRAENTNTYRHLTEFVGLDLETMFNDHYHEVLELIGEMFVYMFEELAQLKDELRSVNEQFPFEPITFHKPTFRLSFAEGIKLLREAGVEVGDLDDLNTQQEKILGDIVKKKYNTDFFIMDKFPLAVRAFYTMPDPENPQYSNAFDVFLRGNEIVSGAQRIHDFALLEKRIKELGINPEGIQYYLNSFQHGSHPHAGCGLGLERVVMFYLGLNNIRRSSLFPRDPHRTTP